MSRQLESYGINILKRHADWLLANGYKQQASSLTIAVGYSRMYLERNNMDNKINDRSVNPLIRIANALEEILQLVKEDQEKMKKIREESDEDIEEEARLKDGDDEVSWSK